MNRLCILLFLSLLFAGLHAQQIYSSEEIKSKQTKENKISYYTYRNLITNTPLEGECTIIYYSPEYRYRVGYYIKGRPEGIHYLYKEEDKLMSAVLYKNGSKVEEKKYYKEGDTILHTITTYIRGFEHKMTEYNRKGEVVTEIEYEHQSHKNFTKKEYRDGKLIYSAGYKSWKLHGPCYNGRKSIATLTTFVEGKKEGPYEEYYPGKIIKIKGSYKDEKKEGVWIEYSEKGKILVHERYEEGQYNGVCKYYYPDGKIKEEVCYAWEVLNGLKKEWFENGNLKYQGSYRNGRRDGVEYMYYENKKKRSEYTYSNGVSHGSYKLYRADGTLLETGEIEYEEYVKRTFYDEKGKKKETQVKGKISWETVP